MDREYRDATKTGTVEECTQFLLREPAARDPMAQQARRRRLERRRATGFYSTGRPERPGDVFAVRT